MAENDEIRVETRGRLGLLTLDRPKALNALSLPMIRRLQEALSRFERDPAVDAVLIQGAGGRAFCAGGDVRALMTMPPGPEADRAREMFFGEEYALNHHIHTAAKPVVALIDGITMGGGCGLSLHAGHVVATERTVLAMPETVLGLFPDVGATWFLNRLPGEMGVYIALTGLRLGPADLAALGLAGTVAASDALPGLVAALAALPRLDRAAIDAVLARHHRPPGDSPVAARQPRVDALFAGATVEAIVAALAAAPEDWAQAALGVIRRASPTSLKVALRQLRGGRGLPIAEQFRIEYRLALRITARGDFREGVRSILIDKDNAPRWEPDRLEALDPSEVESLFAPFAAADRELVLEQPGAGEAPVECSAQLGEI